jgi:hypothetical protein
MPFAAPFQCEDITLKRCFQEIAAAARFNVALLGDTSFVFLIESRRLVRIGEVQKRCPALIRQVAAKYDAEILALALMPDHVPLLCEVDPPLGIPRLVKNIQGVI